MTLSVTGAGALFLLLRLFAVVDYQWDVAFAVSETIGVDDVPSLLFGTMLAERLSNGVFIALLFPLAMGHQARLGWIPRRDTSGNFAFIVILFMLLVSLWISFGQIWLPVVSFVLTASVLVLFYGPLDTPEKVLRFLSSHIWRISLAIIFVLAALVRAPWVPLEEIELSDGSVMEGYVVATPSGYLKVLTESDRELEILIAADVEERTEVER